MQSVYYKQFLLFLAAAGVAYVCYQMVAPFLVAISWAAVMAIVIYPLNERLTSLVRSRSLAAAISCVLVVLTVVLPLVAVTVTVTRSTISFLRARNIESIDDVQSIGLWLSHEVDTVTVWVQSHTGFDASAIKDVNVTEVAPRLVGYLTTQTQSLLGGVAGFLFNLTIVLFTLFFFLRDRESVLESVRASLPLSDAAASAVFRRVEAVIRASILGTGAVSLAQGILSFIAFWALGTGAPAVLAVITAFMSFIPFVGAAGVWVPVAIYLAATGSPVKAIILAIYGTFVISLADNFIRPIVIGDATRLHTLLIFFSILGGLQVFGFLGIFMGPVVLAIALAIFEIFRRELLEESRSRYVVEQK